ncbi:MAG: 50S ribosomal protein L3 [candidate division KSB1 bacterium]|nr:50S ribosomal protein L3 [candidate division KSB1 bacterium]
MRALIGKKLGMSRVFDDQGRSIPVTVIQAGPCRITQIKTKETDGYEAVQLGFEPKREKLVTKPLAGHFKRANVDPMRVLKEFRNFEAGAETRLGGEVKADVFAVGDLVQVTGVSKGKGFAGGIKRHGFHGGSKTHGQSDRMRAPGSIGQSSYPSRVLKGMKMAGRMGNENVSIKNLKVVMVDAEKNLLLLKGAVPGSMKGIVFIKKR